MLTAILWLLLQLKWFNIHPPVRASEVRMAPALPGRSDRSSRMARAHASGFACNERPSFSIIAVLHKTVSSRCPVVIEKSAL